MEKFFLLIWPSLMEDEGRYQLAWSVPFSTYADKKRNELASASKGWFKSSSYLIVREVIDDRA